MHSFCWLVWLLTDRLYSKLTGGDSFIHGPARDQTLGQRENAARPVQKVRILWRDKMDWITK